MSFLSPLFIFLGLSNSLTDVYICLGGIAEFSGRYKFGRLSCFTVGEGTSERVRECERASEILNLVSSFALFCLLFDTISDFLIRTTMYVY